MTKEYSKGMAVLTKDRSFEEAQILIQNEKGETKNMETFLSKAMRESRAEGEIVGEKTHLINLVYKKIMKGQEPEEIAEMLEEEIFDIQNIYDLIKESLPEFDAEKIFEKLSAREKKETA